MPDAHATDDGRPDRPAAERAPERTPAERAAAHAAIDRLAEELLPALIAKLGATHLAELEVREGDWRVRLRRPSGTRTGGSSASGATSGRERRRERGESRADLPPVAGAAADHDGPGGRDGRQVATSPAVGIYRPRPDLTAGSRIRAGDRLGAVEMLGIPQEVVAPVDGIVGASLAESGDAVEYGQELLVIEFSPTAPPSTNGHERGAIDVP